MIDAAVLAAVQPLLAPKRTYESDSKRTQKDSELETESESERESSDEEQYASMNKKKRHHESIGRHHSKRHHMKQIQKGNKRKLKHWTQMQERKMFERMFG